MVVRGKEAMCITLYYNFEFQIRKENRKENEDKKEYLEKQSLLSSNLISIFYNISM